MFSIALGLSKKKLLDYGVSLLEANHCYRFVAKKVCLFSISRKFLFFCSEGMLKAENGVRPQDTVMLFIINFKFYATKKYVIEMRRH